MQKHLVLTATGHDQPGIVKHITELLLEHHGNVEASRMARLGGEFAVLMLVAVPADRFETLRQTLRDLREEEFKVTTRPTERGYSARYVGYVPYELVVKGADHEGIVHGIAHYLTEHDINVETMDTEVVKAPMSGTPLFTMTATLVVPPTLSLHDLREALETIGDELGVDTGVSPYVG